MGDSYLPQTSTVRKARLNLWAPTSKKQVLSSDYAQASFGRKVVPNPKRGASEYLKNLAILLEGSRVVLLPGYEVSLPYSGASLHPSLHPMNLGISTKAGVLEEIRVAVIVRLYVP